MMRLLDVLAPIRLWATAEFSTPSTYSSGEQPYRTFAARSLVHARASTRSAAEHRTSRLRRTEKEKSTNIKSQGSQLLYRGFFFSCGRHTRPTKSMRTRVLRAARRLMLVG